MLLSTAIISARISRIGYLVVSSKDMQYGKCETHLWNSLVVNVDQLSWLWVYLECSVKAKRRVDWVRAYYAC